MSSEQRPAAVRFDPGSGELPPSLEPVFTGPAAPILLLVAAEADDRAARAAIGLADARAAGGQPTVLADGDLDAPRLHRLLDVPNLEGLVDVFLFGASLDRVTCRPDTRAFDFAPAGAYAPDPAEVLQSPRWDRIAEELAGDDALLLVFLPAAAPGVRELSRRIGRAVLIGDGPQVDRAADRLDPGCAVLGVVEPPPPAMAPERLAAEAEPPTDGASTIFDGPDLNEPVVIRSARKKHRTSPILLFALALALAAAAWFGYQELFGTQAPSPEPEPVAPAAAATPADPGAPIDTEIPFSVALEAHQDLEKAMERVRLLSRAEPDITFFLAPVSVNGTLFFRLLAGPMATRESALALMQRFVDRGHKGAMDDWAIRPRPLAFHLGDYEVRADADERARALVQGGIPAYVVPQRYESGAFRYRVYGGAYENQAEAQVMGKVLENAGEPVRLIPRVGEPVQ